MLRGAGVKEQVLKDSLFETLCYKEKEVKQSIPRFIKKALGMLRRDANMIRRQNEEEELSDINWSL